jgi:hypothetical protein
MKPHSVRLNLDRVQLILICSMLPFAGMAVYFASACLRSLVDRRMFIFSILAVGLLGLAQLIVGWIHAEKVLRNPYSSGRGWFKQLLVYDLATLAIVASTMLAPAMIRRNTVKMWERMEREEFNKRKNSNTPIYYPMQRSSLV